MPKRLKFTKYIIVCGLLFFLALNVGAFMSYEQTSDTTAVETRLTSHEKLDDERYKQIDKLDGIARINQQKIAALEERLDSLIWWLRAVFGAVVMELLVTAVRIISWNNRSAARK